MFLTFDQCLFFKEKVAGGGSDNAVGGRGDAEGRVTGCFKPAATDASC